MPDTQYAYDFDPHGTSDDNLVQDEYQALSPVQPGEYHYIIPRRAPFYRDGFKITHVETGEELHEGVDFHFSHQFGQATLNTAKPVYGSIVFIRYDLTGNVRLEQYRTVGGPWTLDETALVGILAQKQLNPREVLWEDVVDLPSAFPPVDHEFSVDDLVGMSEVTDKLSLIREAILQKQENEDEPDQEGLFTGYARQYAFEPVYDQIASWTQIGALDVTLDPTSDLVLMLTGAEQVNMKRSTVYVLTVGTSIDWEPATEPDGEPTAIVDPEMSVVNLSTVDGLAEFGYRYLPDEQRLEIWVKNAAQRATMTLTDLSRGDRYVFAPTTVYEEPVGLTWIEVFEIGRSPATDSAKLGGVDAEEYVRKDFMASVMGSIQETLDLLAQDPANPGQEFGPEYFVSRNQYFYAMNDFIADVDALTAHLNGELVSIPDTITEVPSYMDTPTGIPEYFIFRTEVTFTLQDFKNGLSEALQRLEDTGQIPSKQALLDRIDVGSAITIPFPGGSIETSTQEAAINYLSKIEFNQIMGEVIYVVNEMINAITPPE